MTDCEKPNVWPNESNQFVENRVGAKMACLNGNRKKDASVNVDIQNESEKLNDIDGNVKMNHSDHRIALIVVDFQNDFVDGSLKIGEGDAAQDPNKVISSLNELLRQEWDLVVYTKDWHPANHISYLSQTRNADRELEDTFKDRNLSVFDIVQFVKPNQMEQVLYPDHCIQYTWGSDIHSQVHLVDNAKYVMKGVDPHLDSYSAFFDNNGRSKTDLEDLLRQENIDAVVVAGLAYDICVRYTCLDAVKLNFLTAVVPECSAGLTRLGIEESEKLFKEIGIAIVSQQNAVRIAKKTDFPSEWA